MCQGTVMLANQNQNKQKQNNKAKIKTRERKGNNKPWNELQATCTNYSVKYIHCLYKTHVVPFSNYRTYFFIMFSSLNWRQSKINKQTLASLKADFCKQKYKRERERRHFNSFSQRNFLVSPNSSTNCDYPFHYTVVLINTY